MTINLKHRFFNKKDSDNWIYFGVSYLKLKILEKKIGSNKKISLSNAIYLNSNEQRKNYVNWIEKQRNYFNDSTHWLMNNMASKDNRSSNFFLYICQLLSIDQYLKEFKKDKNISIISENYFLIQFLKDNLKDKYDIKTPKGLNLFLFLEKLVIFFKGLINYLKIIFYLIENYFFAKLSKTNKTSPPSGDVYLFHDLINSSNFKNSIVQGAIFGEYPNWLVDNNKTVKTLPWFYKNLKNKKNLYKNLRLKNAFIPEDWLGISDYLNSLLNSFKSAFTINEKIKYQDIKVKNLIKTEKLLALSSKAAIFFRYIPSLKKWSVNLKSITYFDNYQNQMFEQPIRIGLRSLEIKTKSIGFYPTLHSKNFLSYHSTRNEWNSKSKPDIVACSNNLCKSTLRSQGIPENRIKIISDLQRYSFENINFDKKLSKNLLIILSLFPGANAEMLNKIAHISDYLVDEIGLNITIRPHPYDKKANILKKLKWKNLPSKWVWSQKNLESDLQNSYCVVTMYSSAAIDAVLSNNILVILKSELNIGENFLDTLEDQFSVLKSTTEKNLKAKLTEIFLTKINTYSAEFSKIKSKISLNINKNKYKELIEK
jgi:hypothetical protein